MPLPSFLHPDAIADAADRIGPSVVQVRRPGRGLGVGSGIVMDAEGHVLTNAHVAGEAESLAVVLADGRSARAERVGSDRRLDLAVLRLDGVRDLTPARFADSDRLRVGQLVIAVGNPYGLGWTVSLGVISALGRSLPSQDGVLAGLIQTDAAINPGSSGGPLADLEGRVVGITTAMLAHGQGIGFAIPANLARQVAERLIREGRLEHAWLGVELEDEHIDARWVELFQLPATQGALVRAVVPGSPAEQAGLLPFDLIVAVDGRTVARAGDVQHALAGRRPGDEVELTVVRGGSLHTLRARLQRHPAAA